MHPQFLSVKAKQGLARYPAEWVVNLLRATGLPAASVLAGNFSMADMGQLVFEPPNVSGWRPNEYWFATARIWERATFVHYLNWTIQNNNKLLSDITTMTVHDAIQAAFDLFGIDNPSANTRANLEAWLTAERAATSPTSSTTYMNLVTLTAICPEANLA